MTTTTQLARTRVMTTDREVAQARDALAHLEGPHGVLVVEQSGRPATSLPPELGRVLQQVLDAMARGGTITISSVPEALTPAAAASLLGVSRPTVMKMIKEGTLSSHRVGSHHRLRSDDVLAELRARRARERAAFAAMLEAEGDDF